MDSQQTGQECSELVSVDDPPILRRVSSLSSPQSTQQHSSETKHDFDRAVSFRSQSEPLDLRVPSEHPTQPLQSYNSDKEPPFDADAPAESINRKSRLRNGKGIHTWWLVELLCYLLSLISLIIIVVILNRYNGHAQPEWPHNITLNSVISWFTTLFKANLLVPITACLSQASWMHFRSKPRPLTDIVVYDAASRGPLGSLNLLWAFRAKYVASLGALITVLALGIDPLVQQLISIETRQVNTTAPAAVPRAQSFLGYDDTPSRISNVYNDPGESHTLPLSAMIGGIFAGLFVESSDVNATTFDVDPSCPTGNCTFPIFQTLAVCSRCEDISEYLKQNCSTKRPEQLSPSGVDAEEYMKEHREEYTDEMIEGAYHDTDDIDSTEIIEDKMQINTKTPEIYCKHSLPNDLSLNRTGDDSELGSVHTTGFRGPMAGMSIGHSFFNFTRIWSGGVTEGQSLAGNVTATQCILHWCVNTIEASVSNGRLRETLVDSWHDDKFAWWNDNAEYTSRNMSLSANPMDTPNVTLRTDLIPPSIRPDQARSNFTVSWLANDALQDWFGNKLTLSTSLAVYSDGTYPDESVSLSQPNRELVVLLRDGNMTSIFTNIARSMTRIVRSTSVDLQRNGMNASLWSIPGAGPANGTATSLEVYVKVRWAWLTFPIVLLLLTLVFFALTILSTAQADLAVWKSSPLPLIFNRVSEPVTDSEEPLLKNKIVEMEQMASQMNARLEESSAGLRLTG